MASVERQTQFGDIRADVSFFRSLRRQSADSALSIQRIILVGGYGESSYLRSVLREAYSSQGIPVVTSDEPSKKAVAEGSVIWFVKRLVVARSVRTTYGISLVYPYNRNDEEHVSRFLSEIVRTLGYSSPSS